MPAGILSPALAAEQPVRNLPGVSLLAVTDVAHGATSRALAMSLRALRFDQVLFLSSRAPPKGTPAQWRQIPPMGSRREYSRFMMHDLAAHIATPHVLCVQWDGYVIDAEKWDPAFLNYDYIGAPWPQFSDGMHVGNGGFSLRSQRLAEACRSLPITDEPEDVAICRTHRPMLEQQGLQFAPEDVARRFAYERSEPTGTEFGFHGAFNMAHHLTSPALASLLADLEPEILNRREHFDILLPALARLDLRLARIVCRRLRHPMSRRR